MSSKFSLQTTKRNEEKKNKKNFLWYTTSNAFEQNKHQKKLNIINIKVINIISNAWAYP